MTARRRVRAGAARGAGATLQVVVAVPSTAVARRLSERLLDARLAACVQVQGPITSRYDWKGERCASREWLLVAKTRRACWGELCRTVRALHPYAVPEILAFPIAAGDPDYLAWLRDATRRSTRRPSR